MIDADDKAMTGLIPIPAHIERFLRLPVQQPRPARRTLHSGRDGDWSVPLDELFPSFKIRDQGIFRVLRDSDIEYQEEAEDLTAAYEALLRRRRRGNAIRLEIDARMSPALRDFVIDQLDVDEDVVFIKDGTLGLAGRFEADHE